MHDSRTQYRYNSSNKTLIANPISSWKYSDDDHKDVLQFRSNLNETSMESDNSGANSPPLWKDITPPSPSSQPLLSHQYNSLSPDSRTRAIIRGQWELMEMVKNMPESSYELSLKDLVEHQEPPQSTGISRFSDVDDRNLRPRRGGAASNGKNKRREMRMFESRGLFLNVVSPFFSLKSRKRASSGVRGNSMSGRVSPAKSSGYGGGGGERDWWKKKLSGSTDSDSSRTSNNFNSSTRSSESSSSTRSYSNNIARKTKGFLTSCWPVFRSSESRSS